jgi:hypothetical protein
MVMLVDDLTKLILEGIDGSRAERRRFFEKFVEPIYLSFEQVHQDFLRTFNEDYRDLILSDDYSVNHGHPILAKIAQDSRSTQHVREKLLRLGNISDKITGSFYQSISSYLLDTYLALDDPNVSFSNAPRSTLLRVISIAFGDLNPSTIGSYYNQIRSGYIVLPGCELLSFEDNSIKELNDQAIQERIDEIKKLVAISAINTIIDSLQSRFSLVLVEYAELKKILEK